MPNGQGNIESSTDPKADVSGELVDPYAFYIKNGDAMKQQLSNETNEELKVKSCRPNLYNKHNMIISQRGMSPQI